MHFIKVLLSTVALVGQAYGCLNLHVVKNSGTNVFEAELHDNGNLVCLWYSHKFTSEGSRVMSCTPGYRAWMGSAMTQLGLQNRAGKWFLLDIQSVKVVPGGFVWDGEWFC